MKVPSVKLNNGLEMPQFGLGTWMSASGLVQKAVEHAISIGYRHIDAAWTYGNEHEVGQAIENKIKDGTVKRSDLFITTKLWNIHHAPEKVAHAAELSLKNLRTDYIDLYLMHFPMAWVSSDGKDGPAQVNQDAPACAVNGKKPHLADESLDYVDTWRAMEKLVKNGKCKSIGCSNFNSFQINRLLKGCEIKPAMNQIECHPYLTMEELVKTCLDNKIAVTCYSPLGNPSKPPTRVWGDDATTLLEDPRIAPIAKKYNKTSAQVLIRFALDRGLFVLCKSTTPARIESNADIFDFQLSKEEVNSMLAMNKNFRVVEIPQNVGLKYYPWAENYSE